MQLTMCSLSMILLRMIPPPSPPPAPTKIRGRRGRRRRRTRTTILSLNFLWDKYHEPWKQVKLQLSSAAVALLLKPPSSQTTWMNTRVVRLYICQKMMLEMQSPGFTTKKNYHHDCRSCKFDPLNILRKNLLKLKCIIFLYLLKRMQFNNYFRGMAKSRRYTC